MSDERSFWTDTHASSATDLWATPQDFFDKLDEEFHFDLDVCALPENAKCKRYFTPEQDGLTQEWEGTCWMNPPYGRGIGRWMKKAYESAWNYGAHVVCLVPSRTDTAWWHDYAMKGEVRFIRGRLRFGGAKDPAPFPSAVVVFRFYRYFPLAPDFKPSVKSLDALRFILNDKDERK